MSPSSGLEGNIETVVTFGALDLGITVQATAVLVISVEVAYGRGQWMGQDN
jgi:hypothetical protein